MYQPQWIIVWKAATHKWTHLLFMSYKSERFSQLSPTHTHYSDLSAIMPHIIVMLTDWMLLSHTDGTQHTHHRPQNVLFSLVVHSHVASSSTKVNHGCWLSVGFLAAPCLASRHHLLHVAVCAGLFSVSSAMFLMTGPQKHKLHCYLCNTIQQKGCVPWLLLVNYHLQEVLL